MDSAFILTFRTFILYFFVLFVFRVMGKREIGELSILDLVIFMMMAEIVVFCIEDSRKPLWEAILPLGILVALQVGLSYISLKNQTFRELIEGVPSIIIEKGKIDEKMMKKLRYNFDDLLLQLREEGIGDLRDVEYAILEPSGRLSIFKKEGGTTSSFTYPLIMDGIIQRENLQKMDLEYGRFMDLLRQNGYDNVEQISYCSLRNGTFYVDYKHI